MNNQISLCSYDTCTGCRACGDVCPKKCIEFKSNNDGFYIPKINRIDCIECRKCMKACPVITSPINHNESNPRVFHAYSLNQQIVKTSSSGGIFVELAKYVLSTGGVVCGVTQKKRSLKTENILIDNIAEIKLLQGSKYVQSNASGIYKAALQALRKGKKVLFTGTPCQIAAMKNIVGSTNRENLFLVELICHGVPSFHFFEKYIAKICKDIPQSFSFRNNRIWDFDTSYIDKHGNRHFLIGDSDFYMRSFLHGEIFQKACYKCPFARLPRQADLTLGDYWGVEKYHPKKLINKNGNSIIMINNDIGMSLVNDIKQHCFIAEVELSNVIKRNHNIYEPSNYAALRDDIYYDIDTCTLSELAKKYNHKFNVRNYLGFIRRRIKEIFS